jgi:membrane associated rhomboid family serine protease
MMPRLSLGRKEVRKMGGKTAGIALLVVGIVVLLLSLLADSIGIGANPIFGRNQIIGTIAGAIVTVVGLVLTLRKQSSR